MDGNSASREDEECIFLRGSWSVDANTKSHKLTGTWVSAPEETTGEPFTLVCRPSDNERQAHWRGGTFRGFFMFNGEVVKEKDVQIDFAYAPDDETFTLSGHGKNKYGAFQLNGTAEANIFSVEGQYAVKMEKIYLDEEDAHENKKRRKTNRKKKRCEEVQNNERRSKRNRTPTAKKKSEEVQNNERRSKRNRTPTAKVASLKTSRNVASIKNESEPEIIDLIDDDVVVKCEEQNEDTLMLVEGWLKDKIPFIDPMGDSIVIRSYAETLIKEGYKTIEALEGYMREKDLIEMNFKRMHRRALLENTSQA